MSTAHKYTHTSLETSSDIFFSSESCFFNSILTERIFRGKYIQIKSSHFKSAEGKLLYNSPTSAREKQVQEGKKSLSKGFTTGKAWELYFSEFLEMQ